MAVTPTTMVELNDLAKDYWTDVYVPLVNTETPLKYQFGKLENATFTGRKWIFGVKTAVGGGSSNAGANKTLPVATQGQYDQGEATMVRTYVRMSLDGFAIEVTKKRDGSFRPALAETMADRLAQHDLEVNRQLYCNADGKLCLVNTPVASATQTIQSDYGVTNGGVGGRHVYAGDQLALYTVGGALIGRRTVVSVDQSASPNAMVLDSTITSTVNTNFWTRSTADDDNFTAGECQGLLKAVDDVGTHHTIPATGRWKATADSNAGTLRDLTDSLVMKMLSTIRAKARKLPNIVVTRPGVVLKYSELFLPLRRLEGQDVQLKGGYKPITAITHAGGSIPVLEDLDCPDSRAFFLNTASFRMADIIGSEWADMDGAQFVRVTDKDAIEGYIRKYWNLITIERNANGVIEDLNDIAAIDRVAA